MSKFASKDNAESNKQGPLKFNRNTQTVAEAMDTEPEVMLNVTQGYEGHNVQALEALSELFTLVTTSFVEPKFYESTDDTLDRVRLLVDEICTIGNPDDVAKLAQWARTKANMRSIPIVIACEYAKLNPQGATFTPRMLIDAVCQRADEPSELLGYWLATFGKPIPSRVKRGLGDAARRLYNEVNSLKYDSANAGTRMADVIVLCHVQPQTRDKCHFDQSALFNYLIDVRHNRTEVNVGALPKINKLKVLDTVPVNMRADVLGTALPDGMTWERYSQWLNGPMDARAWSNIIPRMGYMALLRNLRNFEQAGISEEAVRYVKNVLSDPNQIRNSKQMPFRFWSAYKALETHTYKETLDRAFIEVSQNIPKYVGDTLLLVDVSGSMSQSISDRSEISPMEIASVFAACLNMKGNCTTYAFGTDNEKVNFKRMSVTMDIDKLWRIGSNGSLGHGTNFYSALVTAEEYNVYDRVIVLTDGQFMRQSFPRYGIGLSMGNAMKLGPIKSPNVTLWDLSGYGKAPFVRTKNFNIMSGYSDKAFTMLQQIERNDGRFPWEVGE